MNKKTLKKALTVGILTLTAVSSISIPSFRNYIIHAEQEQSANISILEELFNTSKITRSTRYNRNGIYTLVFEDGIIPEVPIPANFEIFSYDFDEDHNIATLNLLYTPLLFSVNLNRDQHTEAVRLTTLFNRGELTENQFNSLLAELHGHERTIPPSIAINIQENNEQEKQTEEDEKEQQILPPSHQEQNTLIDFTYMSDLDFLIWLESLSHLNFSILTEEEFNNWISSINLNSLTDERFIQLHEKINN
jgi:hypothetical protein